MRVLRLFGYVRLVPMILGPAAPFVFLILAGTFGIGVLVGASL